MVCGVPIAAAAAWRDCNEDFSREICGEFDVALDSNIARYFARGYTRGFYKGGFGERTVL